MSTTIEVWPGKPEIPLCGPVLELAHRRLRERFGPLASRLSIAGHLFRENERLHGLGPDFQLRWEDGVYAFFTIEGVGGGTDAYFDALDDVDREYLLEQCERRPELEARIRASIDVGHQWWFRRSAGQPGTVNLVYGYLAAALAELTDGFVFSDDDAWDYSRFPATPEDFYTWYFVPEAALDLERGEWARNCLMWMDDELPR